MSHQQLQLCLSYIHLGKQSAVTGKSMPAMEVTATAHSDALLNTKGDGLLRLWTYSDTDIFNIYIQGNILEVLGRVLLPWMWHPQVLPPPWLNKVGRKKARALLIQSPTYLFLQIWYIYSAEHSEVMKQSGQSIQVPTAGHSAPAAIPQGMHYGNPGKITHRTWNQMQNINHYKMNPMKGEKVSWGGSRSSQTHRG